MSTKNRSHLGREINLLKNYPKANRDVEQRLRSKTEQDRAIARQFGKEFFDGERCHGYGGFYYDPKFWQPVIPSFVEHWRIEPGFSVLDVGCAKGFMLHDFKTLVEGIMVAGIDVSEYAIANSLDTVSKFLQIADAKRLPFEDNSFDGVISVNTIHNLQEEDCCNALREIQRVSRGKSFVTVDAFSTEDEKQRMFSWNLTAKTILSVEDWKKLFQEVGYTGDFYWFIP